MWVRFTAPFDWDPPAFKRRVTIAYKSGATASVRRICGEAAIAAGKAVEVEVPKRHDWKAQAVENDVRTGTSR